MQDEIDGKCKYRKSNTLASFVKKKKKKKEALH